MKKIVIYFLLLFFAIGTSRHNKSVYAQVQTIGTVKIADANLLAEMPITEAIIQTKRVYGSDFQYFYQAVKGTPSGSRLNEYLYKHFVIISTYDPEWYWTTLRVPVDAMNVMNLDSVVSSMNFDKQSRALAAESALNTRIDNIPAGATGAKGDKGDSGLQGVPGTPATPNTASTPLSIAGNNISIQTASGTQQGALSANDWNNFNSKLSSFTETDPTVSANVKAITATNISNWNTAYGWGNHAGLYLPVSYVPTWASITGKPTFFSGAYADLTGKPTLFDGNYNSLTNLPALFTASQANLLYRPITYVPSSADIATGLGYTPYNGTTNPNGYVNTATLSGYELLSNKIASYSAANNSTTQYASMAALQGGLAANKPLYYTSTGTISQQVKRYVVKLVPTTGNNLTVDITPAGFGTILYVNAIIQRSTTDPMQVLNVSQNNTPTATSVSFNITQGNTATVALLGVNVLSGSPMVFATAASLAASILYVEVVGY